jgi:hypothetical protein
MLMMMKLHDEVWWYYLLHELHFVLIHLTYVS